MESTAWLKVTCLCAAAKGELPYLPSELPFKAAFCHCTSCRHMSGCLCVTSISVSPGHGWSPSEELMSKLTAFEFSKGRITHYFCRSCGTHMLANVLLKNGSSSARKWFVMCGALEEVEGIYHPVHEYVVDTFDGGFADLLHCMEDKHVERWPYHPGKDKQLPLYSESPDRRSTRRSSSGKLHARCKCGSCEFWISRPGAGTKYLAQICACNSCRRASGMEWFVEAWADVPISQISLDKQGLQSLHSNLSFGKIKLYQSSPRTTRGFCSTCGATVLLYRKDTSAVRVAIGLLDAPDGARAESWLDWDLDHISYREHALTRSKSILHAFENGLKDFQRRRVANLQSGVT